MVRTVKSNKYRCSALNEDCPMYFGECYCNAWECPNMVISKEDYEAAISKESKGKKSKKGN